MKLDKIVLFCFILVLFMGVVSAEEIGGDTPINLEDSKDLKSFDSNQNYVDDNALKSGDVESKNLKSNKVKSNKIESNNQDLISGSEGGNSFKDLNGTINSGSDVININRDYVFDNESDNDFVSGIVIYNKNITINGDYKTIDAKNQANFFDINNSNVTIKNLKFINAKEYSFKVQSSNITTINVTFENTPCLKYDSSFYSSNMDKFINTSGDKGSAVLGFKSTFSFEDVYFENKNISWSLIFTQGSYVEILNSVFDNLTSKYATVLYSEFGIVAIVNSTFSNIKANLTAGAIGLKSCEDVTIEDCKFINVTSGKNGGAIFADIKGSDGDSEGSVFINNTLFDNCFSAFGGAHLQLGGDLTIIDSNFTGNLAGFDGGAIYTSYANVTILNSSFVNNGADLLDSSIFHGAAILIDNGFLVVNSSNFRGNDAINGAAIYLYDSEYNITNSNFIDNGMALLTFFDKNCVILDNNTGDDKISLNNTIYDFNARGVGKEIILNTTIINASVDDIYFDLRELNLTSPVKNQGHMGSCWAFGSVAAIESAFLKATGILLDISENNIQDSGLAYSIYGMPLYFEGGSTITALSYCLSWLGVLPAEDDVYDELGKISPLIYNPNSYHILDAIMIPFRNASDENQTEDVYRQLKEALIKYGALAVWVNAKFNESNVYNDTYNSAYCEGLYPPNHIVCLVGWDDTFPKEHFTIQPENDGAWIIKNSWGTNWGDEGYYYISYEDKSFSTSFAVGYIIDNNVLYDAVYQYDVIDLVDYLPNATIYSNVFLAESTELLSAVGTYFNESNVDYTINIYVDDDLVYSQSGKSLWPGYRTIKLDKTISLKEGVTFAVEIESNSVPVLLGMYTREHFPKGVSFVRGTELEDIGVQGAIACVKAYTILNSIVVNDLVKDFGDNKQFTVNVTVPNKQVVFEIDGKNYTVTTDKDGIASLDIGFIPGTYVITTYYDNLSIINRVIINNPSYLLVIEQNQTINELKGKLNNAENELKKAEDKSNNLQKQLNNANNQINTLKKQNSDANAVLKKVKAASKVKKSKNLKVTVTLNKKVKGKYVYVIFNGKAYKAKTNSKGIAKITIKKSALKKLGGKKIKYQVIYGQKVINKSVKIKK